ncbi:unnamed protein product, partial [marine sediment metagenome]
SRVDGLLDSIVGKAVTPGTVGEALRHAYPPEDVAGMVNAIIDTQKPAAKQFLIHEGLPALAAIGSKDVAKNARGGKSQLADAIGNMPRGADGIQSVITALAKPGKGSGVGDLIQYLPLIKEFMGSQSTGPENGPSHQAPAGNYHVGGKLGGN